MSSDQALLTPKEVADILRIEPADVLGLIKGGTLGGIQIAGQWRVRADTVTDFLRDGLQRENISALARAFHDPAQWAEALSEYPDLAKTIQENDHSTNSFGAFLKDALRHNELGNGVAAMGTIVLCHGTGAQDFEITVPPWDQIEAKRVLFNAGRLLVARGEKEAISLLDSFPFALFPATNGFNDDFYVLQAEVPLQEYEEIRESQTGKSQAARRLVDAVQESMGTYIRFVAIRLQIAEPEQWEVFVCHAAEDKASVARPLYEHLTRRGVTCWMDEAEIGWGESIIEKIQQGLSRARYVIVVLSQQFIHKKWTQKELRSALALEVEMDRNIVLPLIVGDADAALASLPFLREKRYLTWSGDPSSIESELRALARRSPSRSM